MARADLHVADEKDSPRPAFDKIADALGGSSRDVLAAMRLTLARKLDAGEISGNAIASSSKELRELDRQIRAIDAADEQEGTRHGERPRRSFSATAI